MRTCKCALWCLNPEIGDNATLFLVRVRPTTAPTPAPAPVSAPSPSPAPAPAPAPASPFGFGLPSTGMPSFADMQRQMMQNPGMMQAMARQMETMMQNPDFMQNMGNILRSNPETQRLMEQHPELNHVLNDPETLRQAVQAMSNPAMMQEMMRNNDRTMSNMENHPEGYNMLRRMFASNPEGTSGGFGNPFASTSTTTTTTSTQESLATESPNSQALPNPWARRGPRAWMWWAHGNV